jgi:hypothetical protein
MSCGAYTKSPCGITTAVRTCHVGCVAICELLYSASAGPPTHAQGRKGRHREDKPWQDRSIPRWTRRPARGRARLLVASPSARTAHELGMRAISSRLRLRAYSVAITCTLFSRYALRSAGKRVGEWAEERAGALAERRRVHQCLCV